MVKKHRKPEFVKALYDERSVANACRVAGITTSTAYKWRGEDPEFAAEWDEALEQVRGDLEQSALSRAIEGWEEPVFYEGVECGRKRRISPTLMIFMLKKQIPKVYGDNSDMDDDGDYNTEDVDAV